MAETREPNAQRASPRDPDNGHPRDESAESQPAPATKRRKRDDAQRIRVSRACDRCKRLEIQLLLLDVEISDESIIGRRQDVVEINLATSVPPLD